jgi:hypothetical protein
VPKYIRTQEVVLAHQIRSPPLLLLLRSLAYFCQSFIRANYMKEGALIASAIK